MIHSKQIFLFLFPFLLFSCNSNPEKKQDTKSSHTKVVDSYNRTVFIPQNPTRIISLSPGITEIIFSLQGEEKLIGRCDFCKYPQQVSSIQSVGGISNINVEKIISLNPDLVLIGSMVPKQAVDVLSKSGIPVVAIKEEQSFEGLFNNFRILGKIVNKQTEAENLILELQKELDKIQQIKNQDKNPSVYYVVGFGENGDYTAGGNTHINDMILLAGGQNIAEDCQTWSFSRELLFDRNPDYIFIRSEDFENFCKTFPYTNLKAVKNKKVYPIESSWIDVLGPRSVKAIRFMAGKMQK